MGVCCIVFDIDGMLFEFSMNFLNIEKNKILRIFFLQNFIFSSRFMLFPTFKIFFFWRGGCRFFFLEKHFLYYFILRFMLFSTLHF